MHRAQTSFTVNVSEYASFLSDNGDKGPGVDVLRYLDSTIIKDSYGIGDARRFPGMNDSQYRICLKPPQCYINLQNHLSYKYAKNGFMVTPDGVKMLDVQPEMDVVIEGQYFYLSKVIGAIHGSSFISFKQQGNLAQAESEFSKFSSYFPDGLTLSEANLFNMIYGSVYLFVLRGLIL